MVVEDPQTKQRFMLPVKNNIGDDRLGYQYHIEEKLIGYGGQTFKSSYIVWDQTTNRSVSELLTPPKANKPDAVSVAKDFLQDELANAPLPVDQIQAAAKAAGISWPSVLRAKSAMLITSEKVGTGWNWTLLTAKGEEMSEWRENSNGNYVYVIDTDDVMTVYLRNGEWFGVYDNRFIEDGFTNSEQAMALMEKAVLCDRLDLLIKRKPMPTGWRKTKKGGYQYVRRDCTMTVKKASSGKWYLVINQNMAREKWFDTADEAMRQGEQY